MSKVGTSGRAISTHGADLKGMVRGMYEKYESYDIYDIYTLSFRFQFLDGMDRVHKIRKVNFWRFGKMRDFEEI
jgi:hypothetical protein